jgi:hypothetical protein
MGRNNRVTPAVGIPVDEYDNKIVAAHAAFASRVWQVCMDARDHRVNNANPHALFCMVRLMCGEQPFDTKRAMEKLVKICNESPVADAAKTRVGRIYSGLLLDLAAMLYDGDGDDDDVVTSMLDTIVYPRLSYYMPCVAETETDPIVTFVASVVV